MSMQKYYPILSISVHFLYHFRKVKNMTKKLIILIYCSTVIHQLQDRHNNLFSKPTVFKQYYGLVTFFIVNKCPLKLVSVDHEICPIPLRKSWRYCILSEIKKCIPGLNRLKICLLSIKVDKVGHLILDISLLHLNITSFTQCRIKN